MMQRPRIVLAVLMLMALLVPTFPTASLAKNPNIDCPEGTNLVAKFNWQKIDEDDKYSYVFEKPPGSESVVVITGDATGGSWTSTEGIHYWIIKGSTTTCAYPDPETCELTYDPGAPPLFFGDFLASDFEPPYNGSTPPDISNIRFCAPATAITLASFTARPSGSSVMLAWETGTELDNAGFNLYRATAADGPYTRINETLIAAEGDAVAGASYSFLDTPGYGTFYYQLEDVDYYGVSTLHGPVEATVARPFRRPLRRPFVPY